MKKTTVVILCVVLALLLAGAGLLYNNLKDEIQLGNLATQPPTEATPETVSADDTQPTTEAPDYSAPDFTLLDWEGKERNLSEFEGKPVVLNFWASWCGPCKMEMPDFQKAYETYGEEIHFLMVNCTDGSRETVETAKAFIEAEGYTFPVYFDTTSLGAYLYGASSIPLTYFIDEAGNLVTYGRGALTADILQKGIDMIYTAE